MANTKLSADEETLALKVGEWNLRWKSEWPWGIYEISLAVGKVFNHDKPGKVGELFYFLQYLCKKNQKAHVPVRTV